MHRIVYVVSVTMIASLAMAQPQVGGHIVIKDLPTAPGDYYLLVRRFVDGSVSVSRIPESAIVSLEHGDTDPVDPTDPDEFAQLRKTVRTALEAVSSPKKETQKRSLAQIYRALPQLPFDRVETLAKSTDSMVAALGLGEPWEAWKEAVDAALAPYNSIEEAKRAWKIVATELSK